MVFVGINSVTYSTICQAFQKYLKNSVNRMGKRNKRQKIK